MVVDFQEELTLFETSNFRLKTFKILVDKKVNDRRNNIQTEWKSCYGHKKSFVFYQYLGNMNP